jgi:hypothetical protein
MITSTQIADDLEAAAELLETETVQWCQDQLGDYVYGDNHQLQLTSVCAVGAIAVVTRGLDQLLTELEDNCDSIYLKKPGTERFHDVRQAVCDYLITKRGVQYDDDSVAEAWNDIPGRTREHVVDLFKSVAKDLRNHS